MQDIVLNLYIVDARGPQYLPQLLRLLQERFRVRHSLFETYGAFHRWLEVQRLSRAELHVVLLAYQSSGSIGFSQHAVNGFDLLVDLPRGDRGIVPLMLAEESEREFTPEAMACGAKAVLFRGETLDLQLYSILLPLAVAFRERFIRRQILRALLFFTISLFVLLLAWWVLKRNGWLG